MRPWCPSGLFEILLCDTEGTTFSSVTQLKHSDIVLCETERKRGGGKRARENEQGGKKEVKGKDYKLDYFHEVLLRAGK